MHLRAGARALSLFTTPLHCIVLRALADGPLRLTDLRKEVGGPPQTTLRGHLANLIGIGAIEKHSPDGKPSTVENALTQAGVELLNVAEVLDNWLQRAPGGRPLALEGEPGKAAVKALVSGWDSTMLRALAARPFSLTELDNLISALTYPALERRLSALHLCGQIEPVPSTEKGTPYAVTDWLRQGVAPLAVAARCENRRLPAETPLARIDVEALFLLALPLIGFPSGAHGRCQLVVENVEEARWRTAGAALRVEHGELVSCSSKLEDNPPTVVQGPIAAWLDAIVDGNFAGLLVDGDGDLGRTVAGGLNACLFPS